MAILPILTVPHPLLLQEARPVREDEFGEALARRLSDMAETMYAAPGVGLAAPQVGDLRRMLVMDATEEKEDDGRREQAKHLQLVVNPEIVERSRDKIRWEEGCLSVPEFWEFFERPRAGGRICRRRGGGDGPRRGAGHLGDAEIRRGGAGGNRG